MKEFFEAIWNAPKEDIISVIVTAGGTLLVIALTIVIGALLWIRGVRKQIR